MPARTTTEVIQDHLMKRLKGEVDDDISTNFSPDIVILSSFGNFNGHDGVKKSSKGLERDIKDVENHTHNDPIEEVRGSVGTDRVTVLDTSFAAPIPMISKP